MRPKFIILIVATMVIGLSYVAVIVDKQESEKWNTFAKEHNCKPVAHKKGQTSTGYGVMTNGQMGFVTVTTDDQTCYSCDDGELYWR